MGSLALYRVVIANGAQNNAVPRARNPSGDKSRSDPRRRDKGRMDDAKHRQLTWTIVDDDEAVPSVGYPAREGKRSVRKISIFAKRLC